jgi:hypothetical protein
MPYYRKRHRKKATAAWRSAHPHTLAVIRTRINATVEIPDEVLLGEAAHYFEPPELWPVEQWFAARLRGEANAETQRDELARVLAIEQARHGRDRRPWGFDSGSLRSVRRSRRDEPPAAPVDTAEDS